MGQRIAHRVQLLHSPRDAVQHAIHRRRQLRHFIVAGDDRHPALQIVLVNLGRRLRHPLHPHQQPSGRHKRNRKPQQHNGQKDDQEVAPHPPQHLPVIALRHAQIYLASVIGHKLCHAKRCGMPGNLHVHGRFRLEVSPDDGLGKHRAVLWPHPQLHRTRPIRLQKEDGLGRIGNRTMPRRDLLGRQLSHFIHNAVIQRAAWRPLRHIAQHAHLAGQPGIAASLNLAGDILVQQQKRNRRTQGKDQRTAHRDAPCRRNASLTCL